MPVSLPQFPYQAQAKPAKAWGISYNHGSDKHFLPVPLPIASYASGQVLVEFTRLPFITQEGQGMSLPFEIHTLVSMPFAENTYVVWVPGTA